MLKSFAAALVAASVIASPVLAQGTATKTTTPNATPATEMTKAQTSKGAIKAVNGKNHKAFDPADESIDLTGQNGTIKLEVRYEKN